jgi:hypothetical protein
MGKVMLGLVCAGLIAVMVKGVADGAGQKLAAVRQEKPAAPAKEERGTVVTFTDPVGCYQVMLPGVPETMDADTHWLHGVGRRIMVRIPEPRTQLQVLVEFIGSDDPNSPRQTMAWIAKKHLVRDQRPGDFDTVKFSRTDYGAAVADYDYVWRGNGARASRTRHVLYRKWLYTLNAFGLPDRMDEPEIHTFFDTFALTDTALDHADGGQLNP